MMLKKYQDNMEFLDVIYLDGERMDVKEKKEVVDQQMLIWKPFYMTK